MNRLAKFDYTKHRNVTVTDGRADRIAVVISALCIVSNADAL